MTPDNELPVWPFLPNWRDGITERLSWATVVNGSDTGAEQRYSTRLSPRREFEAMFHPIGDTRTFFDLFLSELGGQEMMVPLWHDRHKLSAEIEEGDVRVDCDTEFGEFMDGGMAILIGADAWSHRVLEINEVDDTGFTLSAATDFDWPAGSVIHPLRRSRLDFQPNFRLLTNTVGESTLRFILNQANDLPDLGAWAGLVLDTYPVMTIGTDWIEPVDLNFNRIMETNDNGTGLTYTRDIAERGFRVKSHKWQLRGREQNWEFRQFLYRMAGRRSPVWMPTGATDMVVAVQANAAANSVQVRKVGLSYIGGPQPGRDRFLAFTADGYQARRITGMGVPILGAYERLNISANLTYALPVGTELSFLEIMRADGDDIELLHHTDSEGVTECSINFRSFNDSRDPAGTIMMPVPVSEETTALCGEPAPDESPCNVFLGWAWEWVWTSQRDTGPHAPPFCLINYPDPPGWSFTSNGGGTNPAGPKVEYINEIIGTTRYQRLRVRDIPVPGSYHVLMDQNNLYPPHHFWFTGRAYNNPFPTTYIDFGIVSGSFSVSDDFIFP